jgi:beta-ribofuranosylaminobenzene 5'-phosphate synthase
MDITHCIKEIEEQTGTLSALQKILLGTDGSVTQLLEAITGNPVVIETCLQQITRAGEGIADDLDIPEGDPVNYRIVNLKDKKTGEVLIHAISYTSVDRLSPHFKEDLMRADIPIGRIIQSHGIEARREIMKTGVSCATEEMSRVFSICRDEPVLNRRYRIIHREKPLIYIEERFPFNKFLDEHRVIVETPSRIHVTLIDMHGGSGRVDGGVGFTLDGPSMLLEVKRNPTLEIHGCDDTTGARIKKIALKVLGGITTGEGVSIRIRKMYPSHIGLGSGSQLSLAIARALCDLFGRTMSNETLAKVVGRGGTSGIGTVAFDKGGFIIDGGHRFGPGNEKHEFMPSSASQDVRPPPVIAHHDMPQDWRILLAIPDVPAGASGSNESDIFRHYCPVPLDEVRALCHEIVMRMLPAIVEQDLDSFGSSINAVQHLGFKKVEHRLQSPVVAEILELMRNSGAAGAGMSSFGPTLYAIGDTRMAEVQKAVQTFMDASGGGTTLITKARNTGATVRIA